MPLMRFLGCLVALFVWGCVSRTPFKSLSSEAGIQSFERTYDTAWWEDLQDPAINHLVEKAFADNPTLEEAFALIDEAQAYLGVSKSANKPTVSFTAGISGNHDGNVETAKDSRSVELGPRLSWEMDWFGRIRLANLAAKSRLHARSAEARMTRMLLASDVAYTVLQYRACRASSLAMEQDVNSRAETLYLIHKRVQAGFSAPIEVDSAIRDLAIATLEQARMNEACEKLVHGLVALCGVEKTSIAELIEGKDSAALGFSVPESLSFPTTVEATALLNHPGVLAAEFDAKAAWAEIGVAQAERLPRLDLAALLTGHWIRAAGTTIDFTRWALDASVSGVLFDGGRGKAKVDAAEARYRGALAGLHRELREAVQNAQDALAARQSAEKRCQAATIALEAGQASFTANEALWKNGAISLLDLEDSRRRLMTTRINAIEAERDRAVAWIALYRELGVPNLSQGRNDNDS